MAKKTRKRASAGATPAGRGAAGKDAAAGHDAAAPAPAIEPRGRLSFVGGLDRRSTLLCLGVAVVSSTLWVLACADFDVWPFAYFAAVPTLWLIERAPTRRRALFYGWFNGVLMNAGGFYWISSLLTRFAHFPLPLAWVGLLALGGYQALSLWLFAAATRRIRLTSAARLGAPLPMALVAPVVMVAFEIVMPMLFPFYLAITQAWVPPIIQIAELTGPVGVSALLMCVNGAIYDALTERTPRRRWLPLGAAAAAVAGTLVFGYVRIGQIEARRAAAPRLKIGVVQGNIAFDDKGIDHVERAGKQLAALQAASARAEQQGAELILWTESSYPYRLDREQTRDFPERHPARVRRGFSAPLVFGAVTAPADAGDDEAPFNTAVYLDADGRFAARFDKIFLLMFGEYTPIIDGIPSLKKLMPRNAGHFQRGKGVTTFPFVKDGVEYRLGPMICYEDILTDLSRELAALHPHLLVNITNDAWFGDTSEPWEHLALSVFRAVETRTDLVRAVNTGVSAFVDATGRVYAKTYAVDPKTRPVGVDFLVAEATLMEGGNTFYARHGDVFGWLCVLATALGWLVWPRLGARRKA